eukprot:TRINITY_DN3767_c1_g1_i1.p1 TRINITY_DN3767_c1_g1~~TRINITY_DN3767_c1_g1_i1.p1  ORF type:complete len:337 (+),score=70.13 TRINITY_DN3767_c1_g1_i1:67-1011(+)
MSRERSSSNSSKSSRSSMEVEVADGVQGEPVAPLTRREKLIVWKEIVALEGKHKEVELKLVAIKKKEEYLELAEVRRAKADKEVRDSKVRSKEAEENVIAGEQQPDDKQQEETPKMKMNGRRGQRMLNGMLSILKTQKEKLAKENLERKRMDQLRVVEEKVSKKQEQQDAAVRAQEIENLKTNKITYNELLAKLSHRIEALRESWSDMIIHEQEFLLSHYLVTTTEPPIHWIPSKHTPTTRAALRERQARQLSIYRPFRANFDEVCNSILVHGLSVAHPEEESKPDGAAATEPSPAKRDAEDPVEPPSKRSKTE